MWVMKVQGWIAMPAASSCDMRGRIAGPGTSLPFKSWFGQPHVGEPPGLLSCSARTSPRPSTPSQTLSSANGAGPDVMISTRSAGLLIDTVVCLTLAKWETMSGRFGGYLIGATWSTVVIPEGKKHRYLEIWQHGRIDRITRSHPSEL